MKSGEEEETFECYERMKRTVSNKIKKIAKNVRKSKDDYEQNLRLPIQLPQSTHKKKILKSLMKKIVELEANSAQENGADGKSDSKQKKRTNSISWNILKLAEKEENVANFKKINANEKRSIKKIYETLCREITEVSMRKVEDTDKAEKVMLELAYECVFHAKSISALEDGDGTKEKPYRYLCAPGATVNAEFMLKMLEERAVCIFDVVDQEKEPTLLLYSWTLDGKTGQVIKPENPEQPETPEEPKIPDEPDNPGGYEEPDPGDADGMTREEQAKQIQEKEQKIKDLDLEKRTAQLELKKLDKKVNNGVVKSTVEGTVKAVLDEEEAKLENKPVISVTGKNGCYVIGGIAESSYDKLKEGMTVMVTSWNTGNSYEATITSIGNSPVESMKSSENPNMSYYPFTAVVEKDADLSSGEGVSISVDGLSGDSGNSIYLEQMFIREDGNRSYVYKKGKHGRLEKQYVEVGKNMYGSIEIVSGLTMEDEIAFPYGRNVKEGAKTKTVESLYDYN